MGVVNPQALPEGASKVLDEEMRKEVPLAGAGTGEPKERIKVEGKRIDFDFSEAIPIVAKIVKLPFAALARYNKKWELTVEESESLGEATCHLVAKYFPWLIEKYPEELLFVTALGIILIPRIEFKDKKKEEKKDAGSEHAKSNAVASETAKPAQQS